MRVWNEVHWHDLRRGDRVITIRDGEVRPTLLQETFRKAEPHGDGRVALTFKDRLNTSTMYVPIIECPHRFFVRAEPIA